MGPDGTVRGNTHQQEASSAARMRESHDYYSSSCFNNTPSRRAGQETERRASFVPNPVKPCLQL